MWSATLDHSWSSYYIIEQRRKNTNKKISCFWPLGKVLQGQNCYAISKIQNLTKLNENFLNTFFKTMIQNYIYENIALTIIFHKQPQVALKFLLEICYQSYCDELLSVNCLNNFECCDDEQPHSQVKINKIPLHSNS